MVLLIGKSAIVNLFATVLSFMQIHFNRKRLGGGRPCPVVGCAWIYFGSSGFCCCGANSLLNILYT